MKRLVFFLLIVVSASGVSAQTLLLKSGKVVPADGLVRNNDMLMTSIKTSSGSVGEIGFYVTDVAELHLPAPGALAAADTLAAKGEYDQALALIDPVVTYQKAIRDIPGNWWAKAALTEIAILLGLKREDSAKELANEIVSHSADPEIQTSAKLQIALATNFTDPKQGLAAFDAVISQSSEPRMLSRAWVAEGDIHFTQHEFDEALLDYLTVTVFYPKDNPVVPKALWGAGQAYAKLKDPANAAKTYQQLVSSYPDSPEASLAKAELLKKEKKT